MKLNSGLVARWVNDKDAKQQRKAGRKATLPKDRVRRFIAHFNPKRIYHYWFSRDGAVMALKLFGIGIITGFVFLAGLFAYFRKDLPNLTDVSGSNLGGSISYYDRTGQNLLWEDYNAVKRIQVKDENISDYIKKATVAIEDKDFYKHGGFDVKGIVRAGVNDLIKQSATQGGSTITQQLVKLTQNWTDNRTITRKIKELILSIELEREYSKKQILAGYLNTAPYGNIEYGVEAASTDYFQKSAKDLTLDEATFLAAIPKAPSIYSPYGPLFDKQSLLARQHYILDQMHNQGMITKDQTSKAKKIDIIAKVKPQQAKYSGIKSPYFVLAAKTELEKKYGSDTVNRGGWKVTTTMDSNLQKTAEDLVATNLNKIKRFGADTEAIVGEDVQTGQIVSLVGGTDFTNPDHGQNNFAAGILLPPGSSFKPYDYATFIENNNNVGAGSVLYDSEVALPGYPCTNKALPKNGGNCLKDYDFLNPGPITLRYAFGGSRNIPAVKSMLSALPNDTSNGKVNSINKVIETASAMMSNPYQKGNSYNCYSDEALTKITQCYGASAIGDGAFLKLDDHVNGLSTFARGGKAIPRTYILKISDAANKTVYQFTQPKSKQVIREDTAYIINDIASDPRASYLPGSCTEITCTPLARGGFKFHRFNGWKIAIKTGTTNDGYDGLMASWSNKYAVVAWVGNHTRRVSLSTSMEVMTEPLVRGWMEAAHTNQKVNNWVKPAGIKTLPAFIMRKNIHYGDIVPSPEKDLFPSWYQPKSTTSNQVIDKISNKIATDCTPNLAKDTSAGSNSNTWNVDIFAGGASSSGTTTSTSTDDIHKCDDAKPNISLAADSSDCRIGQPCSFSVTVTRGTHPLSSGNNKGILNLLADNQIIATINVDTDGTYPISYTPTTSGAINITAQIIDSVLYDATSLATVITINGTAPDQTITLNGPPGGVGNNATFSWSGGSDPFTIYITRTLPTSSNATCNAENSPQNCTLPNNSGTFTAYVKDKKDKISNTITFTR